MGHHFFSSCLRRAGIVAVVLSVSSSFFLFGPLAAIAANPVDVSSFASDEECAASSAISVSASGDDVLVAMRAGFWSCAGALATAAATAGNVIATDLNDMVALESRAINMKISALRSSLESAHPPSQIIHPAFQWAQSGDSVFLNVKFAHKIDAPATLDVNVDRVELTNTSITLRASKERKAFKLDLAPLRHEIDPNASSWTLGSVGRAMFTLKKAAEKPCKWPGLLAANAKKPAGQMGVWWDRQEEFSKELEKLEDEEDGDEEDDSGKKKQAKKAKEGKKEKKNKDKKKKKKDKKSSDIKSDDENDTDSAELRAAKLAIEKEVKAQIMTLEEEAKKKKKDIDLETRKQKASVDAETAEKRAALEDDAKKKKAALEQDLEQESESASPESSISKGEKVDEDEGGSGASAEVFSKEEL